MASNRFVNSNQFLVVDAIVTAQTFANDIGFNLGHEVGEQWAAGVVKEVTGKDMIKSMGSYIWPENDKGVKTRVVAAMGLLVGAKVINTSVPFIFSYAVDTLNKDTFG